MRLCWCDRTRILTRISTYWNKLHCSTMSKSDSAVVTVKEELPEFEACDPAKEELPEYEVSLCDPLKEESPEYEVSLCDPLKEESPEYKVMQPIQVETKKNYINITEDTIKKEPISFAEVTDNLQLEQALGENIIRDTQESKTEWKPFVPLVKEEIEITDVDLEIHPDENSTIIETEIRSVFVKIKRDIELERAVKENITNALQVKDNIPESEEDKGFSRATLSQIHLAMEQEDRRQPSLTMFACGKCNRCYQEQLALKDHYCKTIEECERLGDGMRHKRQLKCLQLESNTHSIRITETVNSSEHNAYPTETTPERPHHHLTVHTGQTDFSCSVCSMKFARLVYLKRHERRHAGGRPFLCKICHKSFKYSTALKTHQIFHTGVKNFSCSLCSKKFARSSDLKIHQNSVHFDMKPYSCSICSKKFGWLSSLRNHKISVHSGEKAFSCSICSKKFTRSSDVKIHQNSVHFSIRPYSCSICSKKFTNSSHLKRHENIHTT